MKAGIASSISFGSCLLLAFAALGSGCNRDTSMIGYWEGDRDWRMMGNPNESFARTLAWINIELKSDGTFVLKDGGVPYTGEWVSSGNQIDLQVMTVLNRPLEQQGEATKKAAVFSIRYENKAMFFKSIADTKEIELKKKTKPQ